MLPPFHSIVHRLRWLDLNPLFYLTPLPVYSAQNFPCNFFASRLWQLSLVRSSPASVPLSGKMKLLLMSMTLPHTVSWKLALTVTSLPSAGNVSRSINVSVRREQNWIILFRNKSFSPPQIKTSILKLTKGMHSLRMTDT